MIVRVLDDEEEEGWRGCVEMFCRLSEEDWFRRRKLKCGEKGENGE